MIALFSGRDVAKRVFLDESARKGYMGKRLASLSCLALFLAFGDFDNPQGGQSHASAKEEGIANIFTEQIQAQS